MTDTNTHCHACGTPLVAGAAYCHRCGNPALLTAEELAEPATPDAADLHQPSIAPGTLWAPPLASPSGTAGTTGVPGAGPSPGAGQSPAAGAPAGGGGYGAAAPPPPPPTQPPYTPPPPHPGPDEGFARALRGGYGILMGDWLSRGWSVFTRDGGLFLAFSGIGWMFWVVTAFVHLTWPVLLIAMPLLSAGFMTAALIARRGEKLQFGDFWLPFRDFLPLLLANFVSWALLFAGLCTCGIVSIYLWVAYQFAYLLILDRRMDFWDALEGSRKVVTREWFGIFAFSVVLLLINLVGLATCFGIIVTFPLTVCALVEAYADIFGIRGGLPDRRGYPTPAIPAAAAPAPPPPPPLS